MDGIRLNKYISESGFCSRRQADVLIQERRVTINGRVAGIGEKVGTDDVVAVDGKAVKKAAKEILLAFNKPKGVICTSSAKEHPNIIEYINYPERIYPIGRLDKDSEGLILLTNMGDIVNKIMKSRNSHEKEYIVTLNKNYDDEFIKKMQEGVRIKKIEKGRVIMDEVTKKCKVKKINANTFSIILTQGLNRQIRRMCESLGFKVVKLKRIRIMNIELKNLKKGQYRNLTDIEWNTLKKLIKKD
ncbi:ribosomal large subunit pseudouridine synthase F [Acetitomaculum ruminis DSM 5522]|uniref:Pseudouridine synthase n=1 Tax=Acetitomaculum ruminis DSM 5522 TaxID=1120918 RepID=A0A1I0VU04_9FIRM|nr:pseudouridine synthase [Acetitomaculum ruminis]SFA79678.1 ribosomal large subunit pseudouridine synthase F [Acetitomaculum ruminis DSM 5522]